MSGEIDSIFAEVKKVKAEKRALEKTREKEQKSKKKKNGEAKEHSFLDSALKSRGGSPERKVIDGCRIYTEDELKINIPGSGQTGDCPFDCNCCF